MRHPSGSLKLDGGQPSTLVLANRAPAAADVKDVGGKSFHTGNRDNGLIVSKHGAPFLANVE